MITVISGTNRTDSYTEAVAGLYAELLTALNQPAQVLSLRDLPTNVAFEDVFGARTPEMQAVVDRYIASVDKFVFVVPEYNGSFPGILKVFIDALPPRLWRDKKAAIVGVSSGRAGNLRGQEHLTGIMHYLKMHVHYNKPKLSGIEGLMDDKRHLVNESTRRLLAEHAALIAAW